jgi:hypothetical protein
MRTVIHLFLILFVSFLATPTLVSVIDKSCDTSYFYSISEEELTHKAVKEFKTQITNGNSRKLVTLSLSIITSESHLKHDNITPSIFSPPPNA